MSSGQKTLSQWRESWAKGSETKQVMTEEAAKALHESNKALAKIGRDARQTVKSLVIMEQLASFQAKSQAESVTLLVLTSKSSGKQVLHIIPEQGDVETDATKLAKYFDVLLQEEELVNAEAKELGLKHRMSAFSKGRVIIDLFISGKNMQIGQTSFGDIARNDLKGLPYFIRSAQRFSQKMQDANVGLPSGTTFVDPLSTDQVRSKLKEAATKAIELAQVAE